MELENVYQMKFVVIKLDTTDKPEETSLQDIWGLSAINEQGEILEIEGEDNRELGKEDYERVKAFIGDRVLYFERPSFYQSFLFASAYSGVAILNFHAKAPNQFPSADKRVAKHPNWQEDEREYLEVVRELILSEDYFDGWDTRNNRNSSFIAHGDVTGLSCYRIDGDLYSCRDIFDGEGRYGDGAFLLDNMRKMRLIIRLTAPSSWEYFYLITTDGEGDPACGGLFPILNDPKLAKLYKEHGLSYFSDWYYEVKDTFSKDIDIEEVRRCMEAIKKEDEQSSESGFLKNRPSLYGLARPLEDGESNVRLRKSVMSWFRYTLTAEWDGLKKKFPLAVNDDLRLSEDKKELAIINHFQEGDPLCELSDPKDECDQGLTYIFYHVFVGEEAKNSEEAISSFLASRDPNDEYSISLYRVKGERLSRFAYGYLVTKLLGQQELLKEQLKDSLPEEEEIFILPLKRYMFKCPVCHNRTLPSHGCYDICVECGWEDEGKLGDDEFSDPNGSTFGDYRVAYLEIKKKRPEYKWGDNHIHPRVMLRYIEEEELNALWEKTLERIHDVGFSSVPKGEEETNPVLETYRRTFVYLNRFIDSEYAPFSEISDALYGYLIKAVDEVSPVKPELEGDLGDFSFASYKKKDALWVILSIGFLSYIRQNKEFCTDVSDEGFLSFCREADPSGSALNSDSVLCYFDYENHGVVYRFILMRAECCAGFDPICCCKKEGKEWRLLKWR